MSSSLISPRPSWYADTDEVAAILESSGINDRVAGRDYGHTSVFALAKEVYAVAADAQPAPAAYAEAGGAMGSRPISSALVRAGLYLTPTAIAVGAAPLVGGLPWYATTGLLVLGWGASQAMAYLGYCTINDAGLPAAARRLAAGFAMLAGFCGVLLAARHAEPRAYLAGAAQLMLFAAITGALVTGVERRTLLVGMGCWVAVAGMIAGYTLLAVFTLFISLLAMLVVAYLPVWGGGPRRWRLQPRRYVAAQYVAARYVAAQYVAALGHGVVGAGQAVLFILVVLQSGARSTTPFTALPLLLGVPLTELMLLWHQRRVAQGRALLAGREAFRRHLTLVGWGSGSALAVPLLGGGALMLLLLREPAVTGWAVSASLLLAGVNALCLVLVAHRRPGMAACMVWALSLLIIACTLIMSGLQPGLPEMAVRVCAVILLCAYPPVLLLAVRAMTDARSYQ